MNLPTQYQKIIEMSLDGEFHCQNEYRRLFIFSPHKRRNELAGKEKESDPATGKYDFRKIPCQHGFKGQYDYQMFENPNYKPLVAKHLSEQELLNLATQ